MYSEGCMILGIFRFWFSLKIFNLQLQQRSLVVKQIFVEVL